MTNRFVSPNQQFISALGAPYAGGKLYFYVSGTSTPADTYQDEALTTPNTNPIILDAAGDAGNVFLTSSTIYKVQLFDVNGNQVWSFDPLIPLDNSANSSSNQVISCSATGTNAITLTPLVSGQQPSAYADYQLFAFVPASTTTGNVVAQVGSLPDYPVYAAPGQQAAAGTFVGGKGPYFIAYGDLVAGSSPGFLLINNPQSFGWGLAGSTQGAAISQTAPPFAFDLPINMGLSASVVTNALTINLTTASGATPSTTSPVLIPFRSTALTGGGITWAAITSALSIVIPSGATLGTSNSVPFRAWLVATYNAGVPQLGAAVASALSASGIEIYPVASWEFSLASATAISGSATSPGVLYATGSVTNDAVRIIGYAEYSSGLSSAGSWASVPTTLQVMSPNIPRPGALVQTVANATTTTGTTTSNSFAALTSGQSQAITPTSSVNPIRIFLNGTLENSSGSTNGLQIARGSTLIGFPNSTVIGTGAWTFVPSLLLYDAPGVATSVTYNVYGKVNTGALSYPAASTGSILELQEIMG